MLKVSPALLHNRLAALGAEIASIEAELRKAEVVKWWPNIRIYGDEMRLTEDHDAFPVGDVGKVLGVLAEALGYELKEKV